MRYAARPIIAFRGDIDAMAGYRQSKRPRVGTLGESEGADVLSSMIMGWEDDRTANPRAPSDNPESPQPPSRLVASADPPVGVLGRRRRRGT
jgi:hypothetical protein